MLWIFSFISSNQFPDGWWLWDVKRCWCVPWSNPSVGPCPTSRLVLGLMKEPSIRLLAEPRWLWAHNNPVVMVTPTHSVSETRDTQQGLPEIKVTRAKHLPEVAWKYWQRESSSGPWSLSWSKPQDTQYLVFKVEPGESVDIKIFCGKQ